MTIRFILGILFLKVLFISSKAFVQKYLFGQRGRIVGYSNIQFLSKGLLIDNDRHQKATITKLSLQSEDSAQSNLNDTEEHIRLITIEINKTKENIILIEKEINTIQYYLDKQLLPDLEPPFEIELIKQRRYGSMSYDGLNRAKDRLDENKIKLMDEKNILLQQLTVVYKSKEPSVRADQLSLSAGKYKNNSIKIH